jgi:murein DD-endopeptidase MepM/ murein hydrolase activator NlpD
MRRLVALSLAVALLLSPVSIDAQSKSRKTKPVKKVSQLRRDLASVRANKERIRQQLRKTKHLANVVVGDIERVDAKLVNVQSALEQTTTRLEDSRKEQGDLRVQLSSATKRLGQMKERVRTRLREMYMEGKGSVVSALIGVKSVGDIASRKYLLEMIAEHDHRLFEEYTDLRDTVANAKLRQDALVRRISGLAADQRSQEDSLQDVRQEKKEVLSELRQKQGELQRLLAQFQADENSIASQIRAYQARSRAGGTIKLPPFSGRFSAPVRARMTSPFGYRYHPILKVRRLHAGVDFGASSGTPIKAAADGVVIAAQYMRGYGNVVMIDHGGGLSTVYGHCSRLACSSGQRVTRGQHIANVGSTGMSTGPHLHFEVRVNGRAVNPLGRF